MFLANTECSLLIAGDGGLLSINSQSLLSEINSESATNKVVFLLLTKTNTGSGDEIKMFSKTKTPLKNVRVKGSYILIIK